MNEPELSEVLRSEVLPGLRAIALRLDAVEARLSALEARAIGGARGADPSDGARGALAGRTVATAAPPSDPVPRVVAAEAPPRAEPDGEAVALPREKGWSWAILGLVVVAIGAGVLFATRGGGGGGGTLSGTIRVAPELSTKVRATDVLYIIARQGEGPPLAVKRVQSPVFPLAYSLSQEDAMMPSLRFRGRVYVSARVTKSGEATLTPGDIGGSCAGNPVEVGVAGADIVLDKTF